MEPRAHLVTCGQRGDPFDLSLQVIRERHPRLGCPSFDLAVHGVRHVSNLNHLRHVHSMRACESHVNTTGESGSFTLSKIAAATAFSDEANYSATSRISPIPPFTSSRIVTGAGSWAG